MKIYKKILLGISVIIMIYITYGLIRTYQESDIVHIDYVGANPTEFTFPVDIDSVKNCILSIEHERSFKGLTIMEYDHMDSLILRDVVNRYKYSYVYKYGSTYKRRDLPGVLQHYEFKIDLHPVSDGGTKVIVNSIHHSIVSGVKFWLNLTFNDRYIAKTKDVESTTIEEYELLRYIGKLLGYIDSMPHVVYPSSLSKHEILMMFGSKNPFSLKEMFIDETDTIPVGNFYHFGRKHGLKTYIQDKISKSLKHVSRKHRGEFIEDIKHVFCAQDMDAARLALEVFEKKWCNLYPKAFDGFNDPYTIEQFLRYSNYPLVLRRVVYDSDPQMRGDSLTTGIQFLDAY